MSSCIHWRMCEEGEPVPEAGPGLVDAMKRRFWDRQYTRVDLDSSHREWLRGLHDAHIAGAYELMTLVDDHGKIEVWLGE